jgi:hypothetical protein
MAMPAKTKLDVIDAQLSRAYEALARAMDDMNTASQCVESIRRMHMIKHRAGRKRGET